MGSCPSNTKHPSDVADDSSLETFNLAAAPSPVPEQGLSQASSRSSIVVSQSGPATNPVWTHQNAAPDDTRPVLFEAPGPDFSFADPPSEHFMEDAKPTFDPSRIVTRSNSLEPGNSKWRLEYFLKDVADLTIPEQLISPW